MLSEEIPNPEGFYYTTKSNLVSKEETLTRTALNGDADEHTMQ